MLMTVGTGIMSTIHESSPKKAWVPMYIYLFHCPSTPIAYHFFFFLSDQADSFLNRRWSALYRNNIPRSCTAPSFVSGASTRIYGIRSQFR